MNKEILEKGIQLQDRIEYLKRQLARLGDYEMSCSNEKFALSYGNMSVMINERINRILFSIIKADLQEDLNETQEEYNVL